MTGPRTVTVHTLDHGPVTVPEPAWCTGHPDLPAEYRDDVHHTGPEHVIDYDAQAVLTAELVEFPFGMHPIPPSVCVDIVIPSATLDPAALEGLAVILTEQAAELRRLALRLAVLRAGGAW
ncbi:hypothetical protein KPP03845_102715 [Streptomyces xanthophaeus]|uniref:DUF6907 domain-containing protein n=1 Tax=Streptomyces xanthophaeus TaxID=67385 RepID=UPI00233EF06A|nr:hypothetical protein [Streptomyces xanthophaeus]WCD86369.1 hypothetical protein KPP03845_102715 [Streptomyces xanthophaeus]